MAGRPSYRERERMRKRLRASGADTCAICGRPLDWSLGWWVDPKDGKRKRHPLSVEYDHRMPRSIGGSDGYENAQAAHRICNQRKGNRTAYKPPEAAREPASPPKWSGEW